jgi:hypothetical protein
MYSSGILRSEVPRLNEQGLLVNTQWIVPDTTKYPPELAVGEAVYRAECLRCHEVQGYNAMVPLVRLWNKPLVMSALDHLDQLKGFMPPFIGSQAEKSALGEYLLTLTSAGLDADTANSADSTELVPALEEGVQP